MPPVSAADIHALITAGRLVEAGALLAVHGKDLASEDYQELEATRQRLWTEATTLLSEGETLEQAGKTAAAKALYQRVAAMARDFPGIGEHLKRTDETLALTRAVRHRSQRIRATAEHKSRPTPPRGWFVLLITTMMVGGIGAGLWFFLLQPSPQIREPPAKPALKQSSQFVAKVEQKPVVATEPAVMLPTEPRAEEQRPPLINPSPSSPTAPAVPAPPPKPLPAKKIYTVQPGDTLGLIAVRLFCDTSVWERIYQRNSAILTSPHKLQPGLQLDLSGIESRCPPPR
ncbi:LysM peptidoglycan-binding domain-containing protein [Desulfobulbus propionicus]